MSWPERTPGSPGSTEGQSCSHGLEVRDVPLVRGAANGPEIGSADPSRGLRLWWVAWLLDPRRYATRRSLRFSASSSLLNSSSSSSASVSGTGAKNDAKPGEFALMSVAGEACVVVRPFRRSTVERNGAESSVIKATLEGKTDTTVFFD